MLWEDYLADGVESVVYNYFKNMDMKKFDVHIMYHNEPVKECEELFLSLGIKLHRVTCKKDNLLKATKETYNLIKQYKFDIIHVHMSIMCFFYLFIAKLAGVKIRIAHSHLLEFPKGKVKNIIYKIYKKLNQWTANYYFACSNDAAKYVFGKKVNKVYIMKNAVDVERFRFDEKTREDLRKELNIKNDEFIIGNVGRFTIQKNQEFMLDLLHEMNLEKEHIKLILIGTGPDEEKVKEKINRYNMEQYVMMLGIKKDIERYYQIMDLFLFPSTYEGLGMVAIEAQISGLKCIASDVVPKETQITELIQYISLQADKKIWIDNRLNCKKQKNSRMSYIDDAKKERYDIKEEEIKVKNKYIEMVKER